MRSICLFYSPLSRSSSNLVKVSIYQHQLLSQLRLFSTGKIDLAPPPASLLALERLKDEKDHVAARKWIEEFNLKDIPDDCLEVTYSRSSGPGGQHVNKTNSKATARCLISKMGNDSWLPRFILSELKRSSHYKASPPSLLVSSQTSRSAPQNREAALSRIHSIIKDAANNLIIGETSVAQKLKVQGLMRKEERQRRILKDRQKSKKAARRED